jgi:LPS-assembly lipoprotein
MSWRVDPIGRAVAVTAALSLAAALGGCGFTPLYATPAVGAGLAAIQVNVPHGRTAFLLGEDLNDALARDRDKPAAYRLDITLIEKLFPRGLRVDNTADRYESHLIANYSLIEIDNGKVLKTGSEPVEVSYAASGEPYAGIAAQQDAQSRAASVAAQRISIDLGAYFSSLAEK